MLTEEQRKRLDDIVGEMTINKESPTNIQFVVNDFKEKYGTPVAKPDGFFKSVYKGIASPVVNLIARPGQAVQSILGQEPSTGKFLGLDITAPKTKKDIVKDVGRGIETVLLGVGGGTTSIAKKAGLTGAKGLGARVAESAALGTGFQAGYNLEKGEPIKSNLGIAAGISGALPVLGTGISAGKQALQRQATPAAEMFINSLIKPLQKDFAYGKNPARGILNEGIVANSLEDLSQKVSEKTLQVGGRIGELGQTLDQVGQISLDLTPALTPIDEAIRKAAKLNQPSLFNSLQNVKIALMSNLTAGIDDKGVPAIVQGEPRNLIAAGYGEAKDFLTNIAEHTRFTGNPSDDKALNTATKKAYGITRELMNNAADGVNPAFGKQIRNLNERYGDLLSAKSAINHRDIVLKRQNILNLADRFSIPIAGAGAIATGIITGDFGKAGLVLAAELAGIGATKALGSTASKTRIAQFLSRLAPEERQGIFNSTPILKNLYERLTGRGEPDANAPKTKVLQTLEDYAKNPKLGLSMDDISKKKAINESDLLSQARSFKTAEESIKAKNAPLGASANIGESPQALYQEIRKFDTAEDFVAAMTQKINVPVGFKGRTELENLQELVRKNLSPAIKDTPEALAKRSRDVFEKAKANGESWAKGRKFETVQLDAMQRAMQDIPVQNTKSQLTSIWEEANRGVELVGAKKVTPENLPENLKNNYKGFPRDSALKGADAEMQEQAIVKYLTQKDDLLKEYIDKYGKISNADEAKNLFEDVGYNGRNSANIQEAASELNKDVWRYNLKNNKERDAVIYIGGSGVGKTSVVKELLPDLEKNAAAVLDGNFSNIESGMKRVEEARKSGKHVKFVFTRREFMDAWENGVIKRLSNPAEKGRIVPSSVFAQNHPGSLASVKKLLEDGWHVTLLDNTLGEGKGAYLSMDKFNKITYPNNIREQVVTKTKELLKEGKITQEQYERLIK